VLTWFRRHRTALIVVSAVALVAAFALLVWRGAPSLDASRLERLTPVQQETAIDAIRGRLLQLGAGLVVSIGLVYTALNFRLSRESHVTDRYTKAIEQLGSEGLDVRLGAIYALERIMIDSPRDHPTIVEVLATFAREHSRPLADRMDQDEEIPTGTDLPESPTDIQAAVRVVGRRPRNRVERGRLDLTRAYLARANLSGVDLSGAILKDAFLMEADLSASRLLNVSLRYALLTRARLEDATMTKADLDHANFERVVARGVNLAHAQMYLTRLNLADLTSAKMNDVHLSAADLTGADLTGANLAAAYMENATLLGAAISEANMTGAYLRGVDLPSGAWRNSTIPEEFRPKPP